MVQHASTYSLGSFAYAGLMRVHLNPKLELHLGRALFKPPYIITVSVVRNNCSFFNLRRTCYQINRLRGQGINITVGLLPFKKNIL